MSNNSTTEISILLPTRGRRDALRTSIISLIARSAIPKQVEYLFAFDQDDADTSTWFIDNVVPEIDAVGSTYSCLMFEPLGYIKLNEYVNKLAAVASGRWLMFWNDDAVMETADWDCIIAAEKEFNVLRMPAHNEHPYAIFPIVPRAWLEIFGYLSPHQISDAWISQVGYALDIVKNIPVVATHDRFDLTGNNSDDTYKSRIMLEGNVNDPRDFNHRLWQQHRFADAIKICQYLEAHSRDMSWFRAVMAGKQNPWEKMQSPECDPNRQLTTLKRQ